MDFGCDWTRLVQWCKCNFFYTDSRVILNDLLLLFLKYGQESNDWLDLKWTVKKYFYYNQVLRFNNNKTTGLKCQQKFSHIFSSQLDSRLICWAWSSTQSITNIFEKIISLLLNYKENSPRIISDMALLDFLNVFNNVLYRFNI